MKKKIICLALCLSLAFIVAAPASATDVYTVYAGRGTVNFVSGMNYDILGYVSYTANTSSYINIYSLTSWVYNDANASFNVTDYDFYAFDEEYNNYANGCWPADPQITPGTSGRCERIWSNATGGKSTIYQKNGIDNVAIIRIGASCAAMDGFGGEWFITCKTDKSFTYEFSC